jgi:hypothetical protein
MLRSIMVMLAIVTGLVCIGYILGADTGNHVLVLRAPGFIASASAGG